MTTSTTRITHHRSKPRIAAALRAGALALACASALGTLSGCAGIMLGGMVGSGLVAIDRRSAGAQLEDEAIELKSLGRLRDALGERGHVNTTSYNRTVLLTGEVPNEADRATAEQALGRVENVRAVVNELAVMGSSSLTARSGDAILTGKVKATFLDAKDLQANAFKVISERGTVYLMGRVTEREANRAAELARSVGGVQKVVKVFEVISEAELAQLQPPKPQPKPATAP